MTGSVCCAPATSIIGFAPKTATVVVNAVSRAFGYVFGDSMAKVSFAMIPASPNR